MDEILKDQPCSESLALSSLHLNRVELVLSMSYELMETGPTRHQLFSLIFAP